MATKLDLGTDAPYIRGDTVTLKFLFKTKSDGNVIDISGNEYWLTVKLTGLEADADAAVHQVVTVVDGTAGIVEFVIPPATTAAMLPATYQYDMGATSVEGDVTTYLIGKMRMARGDYE